MRCSAVQGAPPRAALDDKPSQDLPAQIKETSSSWWRILKLAREEWQLYIVAFFFLLIAALSKLISLCRISLRQRCFHLAEILQPLFSGHIISSVVSGKTESFATNVFWFLGVSVV